MFSYVSQEWSPSDNLGLCDIEQRICGEHALRCVLQWAWKPLLGGVYSMGNAHFSILLECDSDI
jgi:hypothetical protein